MMHPLLPQLPSLPLRRARVSLLPNWLLPTIHARHRYHGASCHAGWWQQQLLLGRALLSYGSTTVAALHRNNGLKLFFPFPL